MATTFIRNPDNVPGAVTTGYQAQNTVLFASMTGHNNVAINKEARTMAQGSVFEIDGNIARVTKTEGITGSLMAGAINYVYAIPDGDNVSFHFSTVPPAWNATKGGWYRGDTNERALITAITDSDGNIVGTNILTNELDIIVPPNAGGVSVYNVSNTKTHTSIHLDRGWHRYDIRSGGFGHGGNGGDGSNAANASVPGGTSGSRGTSTANRINITGVFFHNGGSLIVHIGGNGFTGQPGESGAAGGLFIGSSGGGGGGGSGAGEESYILSGSSKFSTGRTTPGTGGGGGVGGGGTGGLSGTGGSGGLGTIGINDSIMVSEVNWVTNLGGVPGTGGAGSASGGVNGSNGVSPAGMGFGGVGGGGGSSIGTGGGNDGGNGGMGGAPGWLRAIGSNNAGSVQIWRLS